jgi:hypothetical protein
LCHNLWHTARNFATYTGARRGWSRIAVVLPWHSKQSMRNPALSRIGFGDADRKMLYIAARTGIYKVRVNVPDL